MDARTNKSRVTDPACRQFLAQLAMYTQVDEIAFGEWVRENLATLRVKFMAAAAEYEQDEAGAWMRSQYVKSRYFRGTL